MSLKAWKAEFYPVTPKKSMSTKAAIENSLQKWTGLRKKAIEEHGLTKTDLSIDGEDGWLEIDATSCALCKKCLEEMNDK